MKKISLLLLPLMALTACGPSVDVEPTPQSMGNMDAPILVEEFSDLQCPGCANVSPQVEEVIRNNPDLARFDYYHFPLTSIHPFAFSASEASECAADQDKFWEYINMIFKTQSSLSNDHLSVVAEELELDMNAFETCMEDRKYKDMVQAHMNLGFQRGVNSTPSIYVNGEKVDFMNAETFEAYLKNLK